MVANRIPLVIFILIIIAITITFVIGKIANRKRIYKYIPSIIAAVGGIGFYIKSTYFSRSFEDIGFMLLAIAAGIFMAASIVTAVLMELFQNKKSFT